ncbi:glycosyltransferase family 2 protein [Pedobacter sp. BMA]|uniref:glycosyltransferase family 2 protein n=1 Tax=Pedobacter sp. BMA TaxID=1663685 RepID=UPI0006494019|nr:glycosyltransferase family 2 protein [Pedobacter sp. BMA]KLT65647.1 glycosyl transferase [Pedobacter sp. BMA]
MPDIATDQLGKLLLDQGLINHRQLKRMNDFEQSSGLSLIKIALNFGYISRKRYKQFLEGYGYFFHNIRQETVDQLVMIKNDLKEVDRNLILPLRIEDNRLVVAVANPYALSDIGSVSQNWGMETEVIVCSDLDMLWLAHKLLGGEYVKSAVFDLLNRDPDSSALVTFTPNQLIVLFSVCALVAIALFLNFINTTIIINILMSTFFLVAIVFKLYLALTGSKLELFQAVSKKELKQMNTKELPVFTIQLPVYKEDKLIRKLIWNLQSLDYPREKLDIKLLIEEDDDKTLNAVRDLDFPAIFEVVVVPFHMPKTKPKACNYGLHFSRGEYLTIYDAEDVPDQDQLKKVVLLFNKLPSNFICIQCALNYFNRNENFLTKMFTLEYSYWFDYMLPGLGTLDIPIPLGGTSNHFKMEKLIELGGWDPFNVTEDADLGIRAFAKGYKVALVNSTTYEEANNEPFNWIRQRSRWIKGYMQTYLVHMRNPAELIRKIGWKGFWGFNFFIGATPLTFLVYPILLVLFLCYIILDLKNIKTIFPDWVLYISTFNLVVGNILMIYVNMIAVFKRRFYELILFAIVNPVYWLMHSISAYKGLWQLVTKPFYWEKTNHGLSKVSAQQGKKTEQ